MTRNVQRKTAPRLLPVALAAGGRGPEGSSAKLTASDCPIPVLVLLIDAKACARMGSVSVSHWHNLVLIGGAPAAEVRAPRFTRWLYSDVASYWLNLGTASKAEDAAKSMAAATKASSAARLKRAAEAEACKALGAGHPTAEQVTARTTATKAKGRRKREPDEETAGVR